MDWGTWVSSSGLFVRSVASVDASIIGAAGADCSTGFGDVQISRFSEDYD